MKNGKLAECLLDSWKQREGINTTESVLAWIDGRNKTLAVDIRKIPLSECGDWSYDPADGTIHNEKRSFFSISGLRRTVGERVLEQPIILQPEIGYLGMICKPIDGVPHFLMQAKTEPGNVNCIQLSPTIQATRSNFTRMHGGKKPPYLDLFLNTKPENVLVDQIQSEQSSRFLKKRNRNMILMLSEKDEVEVLPSHKWMTLGQIKALMRVPNLVNMDTRTVVSCIPWAFADRREFEDPLLRSVFSAPDRASVVSVFRYMNDLKMFDYGKTELTDLFSLSSWRMEGDCFSCERPSPFSVIFCDISIEGREVRRWCQPLFEANGKATFALFCSDDSGKREFLVRATEEAGCFDKVELGPTFQREAVWSGGEDAVTELVKSRIESGEGVFFDNLLSEEGGRFYHEENRNLLILVGKDEIPKLPKGYFWCDFATLNALNTVNNVLNIQLRNLLALLEPEK